MRAARQLRDLDRLLIAGTVAAASCVGLAGCERVLRNMYDQPRFGPATSSPLFADGLASRQAPPGTVARAIGEEAVDASGRRGRATVSTLDAADAANALPAVISPAMLARGHARYTIYCEPCHSELGDGDGPVPRRGFPQPPSYHLPRLRAAPDRHFFDVMTDGYGIMYSYAGRVNAADRWAIVAWIRHLQTVVGAGGAVALVAGQPTPASPVANEPAATGSHRAADGSGAAKPPHSRDAGSR